MNYVGTHYSTVTRCLKGRAAAMLLSMILVFLLGAATARAEETFDAALVQLIQGGFQEKAQAVTALEEARDPRSIGLLKALLDGQLYFIKDNERLVIVQEGEDAYRSRDALSGESLGKLAGGDIKKITINNSLRGRLRDAIAHLSLSSADASVRLAAVEDMLQSMDEETAAQLRNALQREQNQDVRKAMQVGVAMMEVGSADQAVRLHAIAEMTGSLNPAVKAKLQSLTEQDADGKFKEADDAVRQAAAMALGRIEARVKYYEFIATVFFGLSLGSVLLLAAIGLAITFGVMGVINMAHGELMMLGAYTTYVVQQLMPNHIEYSLLVAVPAAFLVSALVGVAIERGVIRFLYGRPLETLLATFGISLVLQQAVRTVFSPLNRSVETPAWMSGAWEINSALSLTYNRLYIVVFSLLVFAALLLILKKTSLGLQVRAVSQNRAMARAMGVRSEWVDALTFGLGSGIAGVAGVALSQLTNVGPNLGQSYIVDSFMVVVFGGVGNLWGTLVGAMSLGVVNKFLEPWSGAVLAKIVLLVFIILFIQRRPRGLFPQKGRAAES